MKEEEAGKEMGNAVEGYRSSLEKTFSEYLKSRVDKSDPRILSVGCGFGYEAKPLLDLFSGASYLGVDNNEQQINIAKRINADISSDVRFETIDAREETLGVGWDIVILRHPQVLGSTIGGGSKDDWDKIIRNSVRAVSRGGVIVVTSDTDRELAAIEKIMLNLGTDIVLKKRNKFPSDTPHNDYFIMVGKKL